MTDELRGTRVGRTRTNTEILRPHEMLHDLEKQRLYVLKLLILPKRQCPQCQTPSNVLEAAGIELDDYDSTGRVKYDLKCPTCGQLFEDVLSFWGEISWGRRAG